MIFARLGMEISIEWNIGIVGLIGYIRFVQDTERIRV